MRAWEVNLGLSLGGVVRALLIGVLAAGRDRCSSSTCRSASRSCCVLALALALVLFASLGVVVGIYAESLGPHGVRQEHRDPAADVPRRRLLLGRRAALAVAGDLRTSTRSSTSCKPSATASSGRATCRVALSLAVTGGARRRCASPGALAVRDRAQAEAVALGGAGTARVRARPRRRSSLVLRRPRSSSARRSARRCSTTSARPAPRCCGSASPRDRARRDLAPAACAAPRRATLRLARAVRPRRSAR